MTDEPTQEQRLAQLVAATGGKVIENGVDSTLRYRITPEQRRKAEIAERMAKVRALVAEEDEQVITDEDVERMRAAEAADA